MLMPSKRDSTSLIIHLIINLNENGNMDKKSYPDSIIRFATGRYNEQQRKEVRECLDKRQDERLKAADARRRSR